MRTDKEMDRIAREIAVDAARKWMDQAIQSIESNVRDLKAKRARFDEALKPDPLPGVYTPSPVEVMSWFVNLLTQTTSNTRIDLVPNHAAALTVTANREGR